MHDLHAIDISCGQFIQRYHIFRIVVFDFEEIGNLPIPIPPAACGTPERRYRSSRCTATKSISFVSFFPI